MKEKWRNVLIMISILVLLLFLSLLIQNSLKEGDTYVYFNTETDIPDDRLYIKQTNQSDISQITNVLEVGEEYEITFTVKCNEKKKTTYNIILSSNIYKDNFTLTLNPDEEEIIKVNIEPDESMKWVLDKVEKFTSQNEVVITDNAWLATKNDFNIIVEEGTLPTVTYSEYDLPISATLEHFGSIYHMDLTFSELLNKPFEKEYIGENINGDSKTVTTDKIKLYVQDNKLYGERDRLIEYYNTEEDLFLIQVEETTDGKVINKDSGFKESEHISFWYKVE